MSEAIFAQVERRRPHAESLEYVRELQEHLGRGTAALDARIDAAVRERLGEAAVPDSIQVVDELRALGIRVAIDGDTLVVYEYCLIRNFGKSAKPVFAMFKGAFIGLPTQALQPRALQIGAQSAPVTMAVLPLIEKDMASPDSLARA